VICLFGRNWTRKELEYLIPDPDRLFGIRRVQQIEGNTRGSQTLQVDAGAGLKVEILLDRSCDIGAVWCDGVPFHWAGPLQTSFPTSQSVTNTTLYGLMQTCGFDHIRGAETVDGKSWPKHGSIINLPANLLTARALWAGDSCIYRIEAETVMYNLKEGGMKLHRIIEIPLGKREVKIFDEVKIISGNMPIMAMYHANLGFPFSSEGATLALDKKDITSKALDQDGITTHSTDNRKHIARIISEYGPALDLEFDGSTFPVLQVLRNFKPGVGLVCLEPATHERLSRAVLMSEGDLPTVSTGESRCFGATFRFYPMGLEQPN